MKIFSFQQSHDVTAALTAGTTSRRRIPEQRADELSDQFQHPYLTFTASCVVFSFFFRFFVFLVIRVFLIFRVVRRDFHVENRE